MKKILHWLLLLSLFGMINIAQAQTLNFVCDFEDDADVAEWTFVNGTNENQWVIGSATNNTYEGTKALYISNDNGVSHMYSVGSTCFSVVYHEMALEAGITYEYSYDYQCMGEGSWSAYDYLRVALVPASVTINAISPSGFGAYALPNGWIALDGGEALYYLDGWHTYSGELSVPAAGAYKLVFCWKNDISGGQQPPASVDNVVFKEPTCPTPSNLVIADITSSSAEVSWVENGTATAWNIEYGPKGFVFGSGTTISVCSENPKVISGLASNTLYDVCVQSVCGDGDVSGVVRTSFRTACGDMVLPYYENFSEYVNDFPYCWFLKSGDAEVMSNYYEDIYMELSNNARIVTPKYLIPMNEAAIYIKARAESISSAGCLEIGYVTDVELWDYTVVKTIYPMDMEDHYYDINLEGFDVVDNGYLVISQVGSTNSWSAWAISEVTLYQMGECKSPKGFSFTGITDSSAMVNWVCNNASATYQVRYCSEFENPELGEVVDVNGATSVQITGLEELQKYYVWVRSICGSDTMFWQEMGAFETVPRCSTLENVMVSNITETSALLSWNYSAIGGEQTGVLVRYKDESSTDWVELQTSDNSCFLTGLQIGLNYDVEVYALCGVDTSGVTTLSISIASSACGEDVGDGDATNNNLPTNAFYNYSYSQSIYSSMVVDGMDTIRGIAYRPVSGSITRSLIIYMANTTLSAFPNSNEFIPGADLVQVFSGSVNFSGNSWDTIMFTTPFVNSGSNFVVAVLDNTGDYEGQYYFHVHDGSSLYARRDGSPYDIMNVPYVSSSSMVPDVHFVGECVPITCKAPSVAFTSSDASSVTLSWLAGLDETAWRVDYRMVGVEEWTSAVESISETTITISNLTSGTPYEFRVGSLCSEGDTMFGYVNGSTLCAVEPIPFEETFDAGVLTSCWGVGSINSMMVEDVRVVDNRLSIPAFNYVILPELAEDLNTLQLRFVMPEAEASAVVYVGMISEWNNITTFVPIDTCYYNSVFPNAEFICEYDGCSQDGYIVIQAMNKDVVIDNIHVEEISSCPQPRGIQLVSVSGTQIELDWDDANVSGWNVVVVPTGESIDNVTPIVVDASSIVLNDLNVRTTYDIYISAVCADIQSSSSVVSVTTERCNPLSLPFMEKFTDATQIAYWSSLQLRGGNSMIIGNAVNNGSSVSGAMYVSNDGFSYDYNYNGECMSMMYIPLEITEDGLYSITYDWTCNGESSYDFGRIAMVPKSYNLSLAPINRNSYLNNLPDGWIALDNGKLNKHVNWTSEGCGVQLSAGVYNLVCMWYNDGSGGAQPPIAIDNIMIDRLVCSDVTGIHVATANETNVTVVWDHNNFAFGGWEVGMAGVDTIIVPTPHCTLSGIMLGSTYEIAVRTVCAEGVYGEWSEPFEFTSQCNPIDNISIDEVKDNEIIFSFTAPDNQTQWQYCVLKGSASPSDNDWLNAEILIEKSATIVGLRPNMNYSIYVRNMVTLPNGEVLYSPYQSNNATTLCGVYEAPYYEGFDDRYIATDIQSCWIASDGTLDFVWGDDGIDGSRSLLLGSNNMAIAPYVNLTPNNIRVAFQLRMYNAVSDSIHVGYVTDLTTKEFVEVASIMPNAYGMTEEVVVDFNEVLTVDTIYVAIKAATDSIVIDDVNIIKISDCSRPTMAYVRDITSNEATIVWESDVSATSYDVAYSYINDLPSSIIVNVADVDTLRLTDLEVASYCYVWIRANCGEETSTWYSVGAFRTTEQCPSIQYYNVVSAMPTSIAIRWQINTVPYVTDNSVEVVYRKLDTYEWSAPVVVTNNSFIADGLEKNTYYEFRLRLYCDETNYQEVVINAATPDYGIVVGESAYDQNGQGLPVHPLYNYGYTQMLYPASMLTNVDSIYGIAYKYNGDVSVLLQRDIDVYIAQVSQEELTPNTPIDYSAMTLVASGNVFGNNAQIYFDDTIVYDGVSSLVVVMVDNTGSYVPSSSIGTFRLNVNSTSLYAYSDAESYDVTNESVMFSQLNYVPVVRFISNNDNQPCAAPNVILDFVTSYSIGLVWIPNSSETSWVVNYRNENDAEWISQIVESPSFVLNDGLSSTQYVFQVGAICGEDTIYNEFSVMTACDAFDVPFVERFDDGFLPCWNWSRDIVYYNSDRVLLNRGNYMILPQINADLTTLNVMFDAITTTGAGMVVVSVGTDPKNINTFIDIDTLIVTGTVDQVVDHYCSLENYTGQGKYIKFSSPTGNVAIDNIIVDYCLSPIHLEMVDVSVDAVSLTWEVLSDVSQWQYVYVLRGETPDWSLAQTVNENNLTITGLVTNEDYDIYVRSVCGENYSLANMIMVHTECAPIESPYIERFDEMVLNEIPRCWLSVNDGVHQVVGNYAFSGSRSLSLYNRNGTQKSSVVAPRVNVAANQMEVIFRAISATNSGMLEIGYINSLDERVATVVDTIYPTDIYQEYTIDFSDVAISDTVYTVFSILGDAYIFLDDVMITRKSSCVRPTNVNVEEVVYNAATLTWQGDSTVASYDIAYGYQQNVDSAINVINVVNDRSYTYQLTDLLPTTNYYAWVRANCDDTETSLWCEANQNFTTRAACEAVTNLTVVQATGTQASLQWDAPVGCMPITGYVVKYRELDFGQEWMVADTVMDLFYFLNDLNGSTDYEVAVTTLCSDEISESNVVSFTTSYVYFLCNQVGTLEREVYTYFPIYPNNLYGRAEILYTANELISIGDTIRGISFDCYQEETVSLPITLYIQNTLQGALDVMNYIPVADMIQVYSGEMTFQPGWNEILFDVPFVRDLAQNMVIAIDAEGNSSLSKIHFITESISDRSIYAHSTEAITEPISSSVEWVPTYTRPNIRFDAECRTSLCYNPQIIIQDVQARSITLAWGVGDSDVEFSLAYGEYFWSEWINMGTNTSTTLTDLVPGTPYSIKVGYMCNGVWYEARTDVTTQCAPMDIPFTEDFNYLRGAFDKPCWINLGETQPVVSNLISIGPKLRLYNNSGVVLPQMNAPINELQVRVNVNASDDTLWLLAGYITDPNDISTFHVIDTLYDYDNQIGYTHTILFDNVIDENARIAFYTPHALNYTFIDDIVVDYIQTCASVSDVLASDITTTGATITWQTEGSPSSYVVEYGIAGFAAGTGNVITATTNTATITDLVMGHTYDVFVYAVCDDSDTSYASNVCRFSTNCGAIPTVPYVMDFEEPYLGAHLNSGVLPNCWSLATEMDPIYDPLVYPQIYYSADNYTVGPHVLHFNLNSTVVLPEFDIPINTLKISFDLLSMVDGQTFEVGVVDQANPNAQFQTIQTIYPNSINQFEHYEVYLSDYDGTDRYIALRNLSSTSLQSWFLLDNLVVDYMPNCTRSINITATEITTNSVALDWEEFYGDPAMWQIEYGTTGFIKGEGTVITVTSHPATIMGLQSSTSYDFYIRPMCSETEYGEWSLTPFTVYIPTCMNEVVTNTAVGGTIVENQDKIPMQSYYSYSYTQSIVDASMLAGLNNITAIKYRASKYANGAANNCVVYIGHTTKTSFESTSDWIPVTEMQVVYTGDLNYVIGDNLLQLDQPFAYDGTSNIVVAINRMTGDYSSGHKFTHVDFGDNVNRSLYAYNDYNVYDLNNLSAANGMLTRIPYYEFISCDSGCDVPVLTDVTNIDFTEATIHWTGEGTSYEVKLTTVDGNVITSQTVTGNTYTFTGLAENTTYNYYVRQLCDETTFSAWDNGTFITNSYPCQPPTALTVVEVTSTSIEVTWNEDAYYDLYSVVLYDNNYRQIGVVQVDTNSCLLNDLMINSTYYIAVSVVCDESAGISSFLSHPIQVTTLCSVVEGVEANNITNKSATISWLVGENQTVWELNVFNQDTNISRLTTIAEVPIDKLVGGTTYQAAVRVMCADGSFCGWSDTISFTTICPIVTNVAVSEITDATATIDWNAGIDQTAWEVNIFNDTYNQTFTATDNTYDATLLVGGTPYQVAVRAMCSEGIYGEWSDTVSFTTMCPVVVDVAVSEITDATANIAWTIGNGQTAWEVNIFNDDYNQTFDAATNTYDVSALIGGTPYQVAVRAMCTEGVYGEWSDTIAFTTICPMVADVAISDITDATANIVWTIGNGQTAWEVNIFNDTYNQTFDATTNAYVATELVGGTPYQVAVRAMCTEGVYGEWSDTAIFTTVCPIVTDVVVSEITDATANITWAIGNGQTAWEVNIFNDTYNQTFDAIANTYDASSLIGGTPYQIAVRAMCSEGVYGVWSDTIDFITMCPVVTEVAVAEITDATANITWTIGNGQTAWEVNIFNDDYNQTFDATTNAYDASSLVGGTPYQVAVRAMCTEGVYGVWSDTVTFTTVCPMVADVAVAEITDATANITWAIGNGQTAWEVNIFNDDYNQTFDATVATYAMTALVGGTPYQVAVRAMCTDDVYGAWSDTITFTTTCPVVDAIIVSDITITTANFAWSANNGQTAWEVNIFNDTYNQTFDATTTSYAATGLTGGTPYQIAIRALCSEGVYGEWSDTIDFVTICPVVTGVATSDITTSTANITWATATHQTAWEVNIFNDDYNQIFDATTATYAATSLVGGTSYQVAVRAMCADNIYGAWSDTITFTTICPVVEGVAVSNITDATAHLTWNVGNGQRKWEVSIFNDDYNQTFLTGTAAYDAVALVGGTTYQAIVRAMCTEDVYGEWSDTLTFTTICPIVANVVANNVTSTTADISWYIGNGQTAWEVNIFNDTYNQTFDATTATYAATSLSGGTPYQVAVRALCSEGVYGEWSDTIDFVTICPGVRNVRVTDITDTAANIVWNSSTGQTTWEVNIFNDTYNQTFDATAANYHASSLVGGTIYNVAVRAMCSDGVYGEWSDTSSFTTVCPIVTNVSIEDISYHSAKVTWSANACHTQWVVRIYNFVEEFVDTVTTNYANFTELTEGADYKVTIKAQSADEVYSSWSSDVVFTMLECLSVINVNPIHITSNSATIEWIADASQSEWELVYGLQGFDVNSATPITVNATTYMITGLEPETSYDVYVRSICSSEYASDWSTVTTFTTKAVGEGIDDANAQYTFKIYPNPAINTTTISLTGVEGSVSISVIDMNGRIITTEHVDCASDCEKRINVSNLAQGSYYVRVVGENINSVRKLIVK